MRVLRLTAFTDDPRGGNPAGVVIAPELPDDTQMQRIAAEIGYSETAFVAPDADASYRVRYFSPAVEIDFCGHATIAAGVALGGERGGGSYTMHTNSGPVTVDVTARSDGRFVATLTSVLPRHRHVAGELLDRALDTFGWTREDLDSELPAAEAFAGAWHLVLALESRETLAAMRYRFDDLRALMLERGLTTIQVVWRQDATTFHARDPFPIGGVIEDPATGAAAAALGGYLRDSGLIAAPTDLVIRQGDDMGRPSVIAVHVPSAGGIAVTGTAVTAPV